MTPRSIIITLSALAALVTFILIAAMLLLPIKDYGWEIITVSNDSMVHMLLIGDHGEGDYRQRRVAHLLESECRHAREQTEDVLVQTVGDNFYPGGVAGIEDPQWQSTFEAMYDTPCLMLTSFYGALGNHDYTLSPQAQVEYDLADKGSGRWHMPARFYSHTHGEVEGGPLVASVVLDTMQPLDEQIRLIESTFAAPNGAVWRVVVGHHNVRTYSQKYHDDTGLRDALLPTLKEHDVHFYLSGHSHNLQLIEVPTEPIYVIAGGGGASPRELVTENPNILRLARQDLGFASINFTKDAANIDIVSTSGEFLTTFEKERARYRVSRDCLQANTGAARSCTKRAAP